MQVNYILWDLSVELSTWPPSSQLFVRSLDRSCYSYTSKDLISMYRGALLVSGFVSISVFANKLANNNGQTSRLSIFYSISNHKNFIPKNLDNALTDSLKTSRTSRPLLEEKAPVNDFGKTVSSVEKYCCI